MKKYGFTVICNAKRGHCHGEAPPPCHAEFISASNKRTPVVLLVSKSKDMPPRQQTLKQAASCFVPAPHRHCRIHTGCRVQGDILGAQGDRVQVRNDRRCAFTLAEVLITIAIIGTVAALTIPTVVKKVQDHQLKTAFKKTYSNLTNAYAKTIADLGYTPECYYYTPYASSKSITRECTLLWAELKKNLRIIKECNGNALAGGCVPKYSKYGSSSGCNDVTEDAIDNLRTVWVLADGTILIRSSVGVMFDTNGKKAPNKPGYDLFWLGIFTPEGKKPIMMAPINEPSCFRPEVGGRTALEMLKYSFR